ncbi:MAG: Integrase core domain [Chlorobi bacterium]|nr:Integrase core domain [Chlorobiota bacterium]
MDVFDSLAEAIVLVEEYRRSYNQYRPHSALKNLPPAVFAQQMSAEISSTSLA